MLSPSNQLPDARMSDCIAAALEKIHLSLDGVDNWSPEMNLDTNVSIIATFAFFWWHIFAKLCYVLDAFLKAKST